MEYDPGLAASPQGRYRIDVGGMNILSWASSLYLGIKSEPRGHLR